MAVDPYINVNQAVVRGGDVDVDGTTSVGGKAKTVKGRLTVVGSGESSSKPAKAAKAEPEPEPEPPKQADPKEDWVDYAESKGLAREEAEASTKAQLVDKLKGK